MTGFAKISRDLSTVLERKHQVTIVDPALLHGLKPYWVPYNNIVQDTTTGDDVVIEAPVVTIFADRVEEVSVRRDMTAGEIDIEEDESLTLLQQPGRHDRALAKTIHVLANRIAYLESVQSPVVSAVAWEASPTYSFDAVIAWLKTFLRS